MASKVKALQAWCKVQCDGYRDVEIRNMTSSWKSGLAFCAIIHRYRPDLIDYDSLKKENVFENNKLAFDVADNELDIAALLDAEDMEAMAVPDKLCICTYISQYYSYFRNKEQLGGPGVKAKGPTKRAQENKASDVPEKKILTYNPDDAENWKPEPTTTSPSTKNTSSPARRGSSMGDLCSICQKKVYIMERHIEGNKLYHRRCLREQQRSTLTRTSNQSKLLSGGDDSKASSKQKSEESSINQKNGFFGKENKKPETSVSVQPVAKPSSASKGLFARLQGFPKPYGASNGNVSNESKTNSQAPINNKSNINGSAHVGVNGMSNGNQTSSTTNGNASSKLKFFSSTNNQKSHEPMDTSETLNGGGKKYEIVGALVNKFPDESAKQPAMAVATAKPFPSVVTTANLKNGPKEASGGDSNMLHGLLKTLQGVTKRTQPQQQDNSTTTPLTNGNGVEIKNMTSSTGNHSPKQNARPFVKPAAPNENSASVSSTNTGSGCMFEVKENYAAMKNRLKSTGRKDYEGDNTNSDTLNNVNNNTPSMSDIGGKPVHKPILKHTTTTPDTQNSLNSGEFSKNPPKSILKYDEKDSIPSRQETLPPKSILKHETDGECSDSYSVSSPRSILKHINDKDHRLNGDHTFVERKSPSPARPLPPKSILKHNDEDSNDRDVNERQRKSPTPVGKSILKHTEHDSNDMMSELEVKFGRNRSPSPPKSILKQHSGEDEDTESSGRGDSRPKPILKSKSEDEEKGSSYTSPIVGKTILKKTHHQEHDNSQGLPVSSVSTHKPILRKKQDDDRAGFSSSPPVKTSLLNNVNLEGSDSDESNDMDCSSSNTRKVRSVSPASKPGQSDEAPSSPRPIPPPRKSILKNVEEKLKNGGLVEPQQSKSGMFSGIPKVNPSTHSPGTSSTFSGSGQHTGRYKSDVQPPFNSSSNANNFSAFNLNDSIDLINIKSLEDNNVVNTSVQIKAPIMKPAWQIEMEARQGIRQKDAKSGIGARIEAAHRQKQKVAANTQQDENTTASTKLAWQVAAEKKKLDFRDPDKYPRSQQNHYPKSPPPPLPANPPNFYNNNNKKTVLNGPSSTSSCPSSENLLNIKNVPERDVNGKCSVAAAPDFVNSEEDIFGRTSNIKTGNKGLNRTPAFKVSPDSSPKSKHKEMSNGGSGLNRNGVDTSQENIPEWQIEARRRQQERIETGFLNDGNNKKLIDLTDSFDSSSGSLELKDKLLRKDGDGVSGNKGKKKIVPDTRFSFTELSYGGDSSPHQNGYEPVGNGQHSPSVSPAPPPRPPWIGKGFRERPLPTPPTALDLVPKRQVYAEPIIPVSDIMTQLQTIDQDLRVMEQKGRVLEEQIRKGSDEDMDEDEQMIKWFELVNQKNEFVRRESELMYKQKQQELENRHEEVEYELRVLMTTPEREKTASDKVREETLLQELLETVGQRNSIVDSMEEDRIRYIEEDQEIAEVMAKKEFSKTVERISPPLLEDKTETKKEKKERKKKNKKLKIYRGSEEGKNKDKRQRPNSTGSIFYDTTQSDA